MTKALHNVKGFTLCRTFLENQRVDFCTILGTREITFKMDSSRSSLILTTMIVTIIARRRRRRPKREYIHKILAGRDTQGEHFLVKDMAKDQKYFHDYFR